jgi:YebC/PmpR family DNA-binding regulatory protein
MSGHSKWSKIKRAKAATDAKRGQRWSKISRRIIIAAKAGGGNPQENLTLRYAMDEARSANMPNETIRNAIKKGTGELGAENYEEVTYEGYGPGGVAVLVESLTNNRNRTAPELRHIFEASGGQLGGSGCVAWMFHKKGTFSVEAAKIGEDALMEIALEAGAEDVTLDGEHFEITCDVSSFAAVRDALASKNIPTVSAAISQVPASTVPISDPEVAARVLRLLEKLDDHDDVQHVFANFDIPDEIMA